MRGFYPLLAEVALASVNVASGGTKDHTDGQQTKYAQNGEGEVGGGEQRPGGCH
jgi:hypothetical protein